MLGKFENVLELNVKEEIFDLYVIVIEFGCLVLNLVVFENVENWVDVNDVWYFINFIFCVDRVVKDVWVKGVENDLYVYCVGIVEL